MLHKVASKPSEMRFPLSADELSRLDCLSWDQRDLFLTPERAAFAIKEELLSGLQDVGRAASSLDGMRLASSCASAFFNLKIFHDADVVGGTPREAADHFSDDDIDMVLACREVGAIPYVVFGDSHSRLYQHYGLNFDDAWLLPIAITCSGGSARGLINPNSNLRYGDRLRRFFARIESAIVEGVACFFKFGQVDLEYLFAYKRTLSANVAFSEAEFIAYTNESIARYLDYLDDLVPRHMRDRTFVCSVSLPALADDAWHDVCTDGLLAFMKPTAEEAGKLREQIGRLEVPDIRLRSRLHLDFNTRLKAAAAARDFPFVDDARLFWDDAQGKIGDIYTTRGGGRDVHVDRSELTLPLIAPLIRGLADIPETAGW